MSVFVFWTAGEKVVAAYGHAGIRLGDVDDRRIELLLGEVGISKDEPRQRQRQEADSQLAHFRQVSSRTADCFEEYINGGGCPGYAAQRDGPRASQGSAGGDFPGENPQKYT